MREILFRGKRIDNGEWVYGYLIHDEFCNVNIPYIGYLNYDNVSVYEVDPETVGQYTGLTDKNGKKIFEGDIISIPFEEDRSPYEENCIYYENGEVYFDSEHYGWYVRFFDDDTLSIWEYDNFNIIVIDNIYDSPEQFGIVEQLKGE